MPQPSTSLISFLLELTSCVKGPVYVPDDEGYGAEISPYKTAVVHTPDVVVGAISTIDIAETVRLARRHGFSAAVQATGHGALDPIKSGVLISTKRMDQVRIDPDTCTATIVAGVK